VTFPEGGETRKRYHELSTALQHELSVLEVSLAKLGHTLKCERVSDSEIILSIDKQTVASGFKSDDVGI
jgi:hypothetical protein